MKRRKQKNKVIVVFACALIVLASSMSVTRAAYVDDFLVYYKSQECPICNVPSFDEQYRRISYVHGIYANPEQVREISKWYQDLFLVTIYEHRITYTTY